MSTANGCSPKAESCSDLKSVPDFLKDHIGSREILVLGMNPSENKRPIKNGTFCRLAKWMKEVGVPHWDFHNVVPDKTGDVKMEDVDWDELHEKIQGRKIIICLGTFVGKVMEKMIFHARCIRIDHPSARNRNFNDASYEGKMLKRLKEELDDGLGRSS